MPNTYTPLLVARARKFRRDMPPAERKLWFEGLRSMPVHFRRQRPFGPCVVDFYCASAKLVVELDGDSHDHSEAQARDHHRDVYLSKLGLRILRFTNAQVLQEFDGVMATITEAVRTPPSPSVTPPLHAGEAEAVVCLPYAIGEVAAKPPEG